MSYQVLARRYRPATFQGLEGQEHVLQALVNALNQNRLHHAYLFTGTRGVGKTTIARILAKCLNCEGGVTATPCGTCSSCVAIAEGRSVDLLEVDAASRTGVDDMRELLDNVQYMPTSSRFKVYLIDEVHMLSKSSFNAMLKTLEEPPEHVKFLFATTDPKKLPITVLSRCLQMNLKNLSPEQIVRYLVEVLAKESITYEDEALWKLGRAADGSMRDALSLTDQAISYGDNAVTDESVTSMLGNADQQEVFGLVDALAARDADRALSLIAGMAVFAPDFAGLLDDLLSVLHRVAIAQLAPDAIDNSQGDMELVQAVARMMSQEDVQLLYQIGINGRRDLPYAPDDRGGFEMTLLRMIAFTPLEESDEAAGGPSGDTDSPVGAILSSLRSTGAEAVKSATAQSPVAAAEDSVGPAAAAPAQEVPAADSDLANAPREEGNKAPAPIVVPREQAQPSRAESVDIAGKSWADILGGLKLTGVTHTLAANCSIGTLEQDGIKLILNERHASLWNKTHEGRIARALKDLTGREMKISIEIGLIEEETPAQLDRREKDEAQARAVEVMQNDEVVRTLIERFDGTLDQSSITPIRSGHQP